jgi:trans-aconitate methyltransferase
MNNWQTVWGRRQLSDGSASPLQALIDLDGFDGGAGRIEEAAWRTYVADVARKLGMRAGQSVFEIGCGSGAFLYPLSQAGLSVAGLDYSPVLIDAARNAMPAGQFECAEASAFDAEPGRYDFVIANSVFHYFPDEAYARRVIVRMLSAAEQGAAFLELPDLSSRNQAEATRRDMLTVEEYEKKYAGLAHQYFRREMFAEIGEQFGFRTELVDQSIDGYAQNPFRFNCFMHKVKK